MDCSGPKIISDEFDPTESDDHDSRINNPVTDWSGFTGISAIPRSHKNSIPTTV